MANSPPFEVTRGSNWVLICCRAVIKLKQVDHVNQERQVLADVAGHPFITTLITSFSDNDSLYMLVSPPPGN
jgi:hypothetical protein